MSKLTLHKSKVRAYRRPWVLRRGEKVLASFPTGQEAIQFVRELLTAARP